VSGVERVAAHLAHRWLVRRGWIVQLNTPDHCTHVYRDADGRLLDAGWRPFFSVRYGHQAVYRGPGEVRWKARAA
jgi:hypothetical protein